MPANRLKFTFCFISMYPSNLIYSLRIDVLKTSVGSAHGSAARAKAVPTSLNEVKDIDKEPQAPNGNTQPQEVLTSGQDDEMSDSSDEDYFSVTDANDSEDGDGIEEENDADWEAREKERQRVLEAAGLIVNEDVKPPPRLARARSARQRRPPPPAPQRSSIISNASSKDLPSIPDSPAENSPRLDDAFDRYESFKHTQGNSNRLSVASSFETAPSSPGSSPSISLSPSMSRDGENRSKSHILNFLGRRTPASDGPEKRTLTISGPIIHQSDSPSRESSPAFGSVHHLH